MVVVQNGCDTVISCRVEAKALVEESAEMHRKT